jgi:hypothetical protein
MGSVDLASYHMGVLCVLGASLLSGVSAALTQKALSGKKPRHALLYTTELACFGILTLITTIYFSPERSSLLSGDLFEGWTAKTFIPITSNVSSYRYVNDITDNKKLI